MNRVATLAIAVALVAVSRVASAADCTNASATLCKKVIDGKTYVFVNGNCGDGSAPAKASVSYTEGGTKTSATGTGRSGSEKASVGVSAPSSSSTTCTATVSGSDCGPTTGESKTLANIPDC